MNKAQLSDWHPFRSIYPFRKVQGQYVFLKVIERKGTYIDEHDFYRWEWEYRL